MGSPFLGRTPPIVRRPSASGACSRLEKLLGGQGYSILGQKRKSNSLARGCLCRLTRFVAGAIDLHCAVGAVVASGGIGSKLAFLAGFLWRHKLTVGGSRLQLMLDRLA